MKPHHTPVSSVRNDSILARGLALHARLGLLAAGLGLASLGASGCAETTPGDALGHSSGALTAEQCSFFAENDSVTFCHAANLKKGKYVLIRTNTEGCVNGHADHAGDFISLDGTCNNSACFPVGTPYDATVTCCDNMDVFEGACACLEGYETLDDATCTDVDECAEGLDNCDANATCTNTDGGFDCACNAGFWGDGKTCSDIDECAKELDDCDGNATCTNTVGSFNCECNKGYEGKGTYCVNVDECAKGLDDCDTNATCTDTDGSFSCACNKGFEGDGRSCKEVNVLRCGDGVVNQTTELCDLGEKNGVPGSGCKSDCTLEVGIKLSAQIHEHCDPYSTFLTFTQDTATLNWPTNLNRPSYVTLGANTGIILFSGYNFTGQQIKLTSNTNFCGTSYPDGTTVNDRVLSFQLFYVP